MKFNVFTIFLLTSILMFLGCGNESLDTEKSDLIITNYSKVYDKLSDYKDNSNDYKSKMDNINFQYYKNLFDDYAYYSKIVSDKDFSIKERKEAANYLSELFKQNIIIEDFINEQINSYKSVKYLNKVLLTCNRKISFANIKYRYDLKNDVPIIVYEAVKLIYYPDSGNKYLVIINVEMIRDSGKEEPMIANIKITDWEECS